MAQHDIRTQVEMAVESHRLWSPGATLVVAVSGGADSLCVFGQLLDIRMHHSPCAPGKLVVAHLDHGLRGDVGTADAIWVATFAERHGVDCFVGHENVAEVARREQRSLEDAARQARYAFLHRVARQVGADRIVTGHTLDDQAETILLHLLRGAGLKGLAGMRPLRDAIARPLLGVRRAETVRYCMERGWEPREDASNTDLRFLRNRIRLDVLPMLEAINPSLKQSLARNASLIAADDEYLASQANEAWNGTVLSVNVEGAHLKRDELTALPLALRHRVFRRAAALISGEQDSLAASHILALDLMLESGQTGATFGLPGNLTAILGYHALGFEHGRIGGKPAQVAEIVALTVPGTADFGSWRVSAEELSNPAGLDRAPQHAQPPARAGTTADLDKTTLRAYVDADALSTPLIVRGWRAGDRFLPLGMSHEKKLQDYFVDAKVSREMRATLPVVASNQHIVWVAGQRIDDRVKLTPSTRRIVLLEMRPRPVG